MNNNTQGINLNQLMTLIMLFLIGGALGANPGRYAGQNVWIAYLIGALLGTLLFTMYYRISKIHDHQSLLQIFKSCFGKYIGMFLLLVYAIFFLLRTISIGNFISEMAQQTLMIGANQRLTIALLIIPLVVGSLYGLKSIGRSSEILFVITIICLIPFITTVFFTHTFKVEKLLPILAEGLFSIRNDIVRVAFIPHGSLFMFLTLFPYVAKEQNKGILKRSYIAIGVSVLIMITIEIITVGVLGATLTANSSYTFYSAVRAASMNGLFARFDPLAIIITINSLYFELLLFFFASVLIIQSLHKKFNFKFVVVIVSILIFIVAPFIKIQSVSFVLNTLPFKILPIFELGIPLLIFIISEIKHRKKKNLRTS